MYLLYADEENDIYHIRTGIGGKTLEVNGLQLKRMVSSGEQIHGVGHTLAGSWDDWLTKEGLFVSPTMGRSGVVSRYIMMYGMNSSDFEYDHNGTLTDFKFQPSKETKILIDDICSVIDWQDHQDWWRMQLQVVVKDGIKLYNPSGFDYEWIFVGDITEARDDVFYGICNCVYANVEKFTQFVNLGHRGEMVKLMTYIEYGVNLFKKLHPLLFDDRLNAEFHKMYRSKLLGLHSPDRELHPVFRLEDLSYEKFLSIVRRTVVSDSCLDGVTVINGEGEEVRNGLSYVLRYFLIGGDDRELYQVLLNNGLVG